MSKNAIRIGIAGYGSIGKRRRSVLDEDPRVDVVGVCDIALEGRSALADGVLSFASYERLFEEDLDAVFVCLPNNLAPFATVAALERDFHVFCEKPPGRTVADIEQVRKVHSSRPKLKLKYGFNHRYHQSVLDALSLVESGQYGRVINLRGVYGKSAFIPWPRPQASGTEGDDLKAWRTSRSIAGGGILLDQGIHMLDLMGLFAGPFDTVKSFVSNAYWGHDVEDNAYALLRTQEGIVAMIHSSATEWRHRFSLELSMEDGAIVLGGILSGTKSYGEETLTVVHREDDANGIPRETRTSYIRDDSWRLEIDEFIEAVETGGDIIHGTSQDALQSMSLVHQIYEADPNWQEFVSSFRRGIPEEPVMIGG